jgi:hypothetical protein
MDLIAQRCIPLQNCCSYLAKLQIECYEMGMPVMLEFAIKVNYV